jgi:aldehyde dehydrogenase (NAD+)
MRALLEKLQIKETNPGVCTGRAEWIADERGETLVSSNPTTGEPIASVVQATGSTYEKVVRNAQAAFETWRVVPAPKRGLIVQDLANALREYQEPLGELVSLEMGKIRPEGVGEVQEMIDICGFAAGLSRQLYGLTIKSERPDHRMYEQWHPLGPIGIITSFNFPVAVWSWNAAIAAVCGDTIVWKPSSTTPLAAIAVQHIVNRVVGDYDVDGVFSLVIGSGSSVGERLIADDRIRLVSFTGSTRMGRRVSEVVARRLGRTILELGGNNAVIVTPSANMGLAVRAILFAAVGTAGQRCTTARRLIAHESIVEELTNRMVQAYEQVRIGDPLQEGTSMGPLVNEEAVEKMMAALERAREQGGRVLTGGRRLPELGPTFVEPTIVSMPEQTSLVCEETFAPILYVMTYRTLEQAIAMQNDVPQGLSSGIFSRDLLESETFLSARGSDCGIANVNIGTSGAEIGGAFGGEKETGGGRESGSDAWKGYMRRQTVTINWSGRLPLAQGIEFG